MSTPADTTTQQSGPYERISTSKELRQRCMLPGDGSQAALKAVSRAEQAMDQLSVNFDDWINTEIGRLMQAREQTDSQGLFGPAAEQLFAVSHDLKGQAGTLGYPLVGEVCASLCRLLDVCGQDGPLPAVLVKQHVEAAVAMVREDAKGRDNPKASILVRKLYDVTEDYLTQLSRRRDAEREADKK